MSTVGSIKIGVTNNVKQRLKDVQTANPNDVKLEYSFSCEIGEERKIEAEIHHLFHSIRLRGEWFKDDPCLLDFITFIILNGWDSRGQWIQQHYSPYKNTLKKIKKLMADEKGYTTFKDKFKKDVIKELGFQSSPILEMPKIPQNFNHAVREWVSKRDASFTRDDLYRHYELPLRSHGNTHISSQKKYIGKILKNLEKDGFVTSEKIFKRTVFKRVRT